MEYLGYTVQTYMHKALGDTCTEVRYPAVHCASARDVGFDQVHTAVVHHCASQVNTPLANTPSPGVELYGHSTAALNSAHGNSAALFMAECFRHTATCDCSTVRSRQSAPSFPSAPPECSSWEGTATNRHNFLCAVRKWAD
eukprot:scpid108812/ scgid28093/ 